MGCNNRHNRRDIIAQMWACTDAFIRSILPSTCRFGPLHTNLGWAAATSSQSFAGAEAAEVDVIVARQVQDGQLAAERRCQKSPRCDDKRQEEHNNGRLHILHSLKAQCTHDSSKMQVLAQRFQ